MTPTQIVRQAKAELMSGGAMSPETIRTLSLMGVSVSDLEAELLEQIEGQGILPQDDVACCPSSLHASEEE